MHHLTDTSSSVLGLGTLVFKGWLANWILRKSFLLTGWNYQPFSTALIPIVWKFGFSCLNSFTFGLANRLGSWWFAFCTGPVLTQLGGAAGGLSWRSWQGCGKCSLHHRPEHSCALSMSHQCFSKLCTGQLWNSSRPGLPNIPAEPGSNGIWALSPPCFDDIFTKRPGLRQVRGGDTF